jgi:hypothetical protein
VRVSVVSRVTIDARQRDVFKYLADTSYHFFWNPHLQSLNPKGPLKLGSSYKTSSLFLGVKVSGENHVTKLVANRELQIENNTGTLVYKVNYHLQAGPPTLLICTTKVTAKGNTFAFTMPILKLLARRELQSDLKALKLAVEQKLGS